MEPSLRGYDRILSLPYGFWNENFGVTAAYVYAINGYPQPQSAMLAPSWPAHQVRHGFFHGADHQGVPHRTLFLDPIVSIGYFRHLEAYIDGNPDFPDERAGSHDSDADNFITGRAGTPTFDCVSSTCFLSAAGANGPAGLPVERRYADWRRERRRSVEPVDERPDVSELWPFYRTQNIENDDLDEEQNTNGLELSVFWDNRDYPGNPFRGNAVTLRAARDWGLADSSASWTSFTPSTTNISTSEKSRAFDRAC